MIFKASLAQYGVLRSFWNNFCELYYVICVASDKINVIYFYIFVILQLELIIRGISDKSDYICLLHLFNTRTIYIFVRLHGQADKKTV